MLRALARGFDALALVPDLVLRMELDRPRMSAAISADMHATDAAVELARKGVPFRTAYRQVADGLSALGERSAGESLAARVSPGATADLMLGVLRARLHEVDSPVPEAERG